MTDNKRDIREVLKQLQALANESEFSVAVGRLLRDLNYQPPEHQWHYATLRVCTHLERWRVADAPFFREAFGLWMGRPWREGDPAPVTAPALKPCPFCGANTAKVINDWAMPEAPDCGHYEIECGTCQAYTWGATLDVAAATWNRRPGPGVKP
jgi:hypothetical protein